MNKSLILLLLILFSQMAQSEGERAWIWGTMPYLDENNDTIVYNSPTSIGDKTMFRHVKSYGNATIFQGILPYWLYVMGDNSYGKLGVGHYNSPVQYDTIVNHSSNYIDMCRNSSLIIKGDRTLWVAGKNNYGKFGDDIQEEIINEFRQIEIGSQFKYASIHDDYILAVKMDNTLWSCGRNKNGVLGLGDTIDRRSFTQVENLDIPFPYNTDYYVLAGDNAAYAFSYGKIYMWGNTYEFDHIERISYIPFKHTIEKRFANVMFRNGYYLAVGGSIYGWGTDTNGRSQNSTTSSTSFTEFPKHQLDYMGQFDDIALGENHCIGSRGPFSKISYTWGRNNYNQFGFETKDSILYNYTHFPYGISMFDVSLAEKYTVIIGFAGTGINVSGYVLNQGVGVEGVKINIDTLITYSGEDGAYIFKNIPLDSHKVEVSSPLYTFDKHEHNVLLTDYIKDIMGLIENLNFNVKEVLSVNEDNHNDLLVSPNPSNNKINIKKNISFAGNYKLSIYDNLGKEIKDVNLNYLPQKEFSMEIDISDFPIGIYSIKLTGMGESITTKFIKD